MRLDEDQLREAWRKTIPRKLRARHPGAQARKCVETRSEKDKRIARQKRQAYGWACDARSADDAFIIDQYRRGVLIRLIASADGAPDSVKAMNTHQIKERLEYCHRAGRKLTSLGLSKKHRD